MSIVFYKTFNPHTYWDVGRIPELLQILPKTILYIILACVQNSISVDEIRHDLNRFGTLNVKEGTEMAKSKINIPQAKQAMDQFKMEAAREVGVNLSQGYNGDITSKQAGSVGGQMVKKMIEDYEGRLK